MQRLTHLAEEIAAMATEFESDADEKLTIGRGPSYPFIDLRRAVERIEQMAAKGAERAKLPPETFYKFWGYGSKSSGARQTMAAVNSYGLVEYVGRGKERRVQLTDLGRRIVLDRRPNSPERAQALATAALEPPIFAELAQQYGPFYPDPDVMISWLTIDRGFNQQGAEGCVTNFLATIEYAGLDKPRIVTLEGEADENANDPAREQGDARIGDLVDWEAEGVLRNEAPLRVRALSGDQQWVFVEGSQTGIPMKEVIIRERAAAAAAQSAPPTLPETPQRPATPEPGKRWSTDLITGPLDVAFERKTVVVQGRTGSAEELGEFIEALQELKSVLEKSAASKNKFLSSIADEDDADDFGSLIG